MSWQPPTELPDLRRVDNNRVAIDTETNDEGLRADRGSSWPWGDGWVCGIPIAWREGGEMRKSYIPLRHPESCNFEPTRVARWLTDHIEAGLHFVTLNGPYDWGWLGADLGIKMPPSSQLEEVGVLAALVDENMLRYSLDALCTRFDLPGKDMTRLKEACEARGFKLNGSNPPQSYIWQLPAEVCGEYGEADPISTLLLYETLLPIIMREGTYTHYRLEVDLMPMTIAMRRKGVRIDQDAAEQARDLLLGKRDAALKQLSDQHGALIGMDEINSPKWKINTFEQYGIISPHKTPTGKPSFAGGNTGWMSGHQHWLPSGIATASKYDAAGGKFLQGFILDYIVDGRIHAEFNQFKSEDGGAKSLRFSISNPPLQQMPIRDPEMGPLIRRVFLPEQGEFWAKPDISQQEFRKLVHFAEQHQLPGAKEAGDNYRNNRDADYHKFVAEITGLPRPVAKPTNFMKIYGGGIAVIAAKTGLSLDDAKAAMVQYDAKLPFVSKLSRIYQNDAERTGITTLYGGAVRHWNKYEARGKTGKKKDSGPCSLEEARIRVSDPDHPWYGRKLQLAKTYTALNALIQGSSAVHTKLWMLSCWREGILPMIQVHDSLESSVATRAQGEMIARLGEEAVKLSVPMRVDLKFGNNWADAEHSWEDLTGEARLNGATYSIPATPPVADENDKLDPDPVPDAPSTALDKHLVWVTRFPDQYASSLLHGFTTLPRIAVGIRRSTAKTKEKLPWIKLQKFGDKATDRNCLRNNANVIEISGLEGEHDKGTLTFEEALELLRQAGIRCLIYTSPSYVPGEKERWRVLVPFSGFLEPSFRVGLLARLNGILNGVLAPESFTLSQAYYYGSVNNNPNHRVEVLDGDFIDLRDDLITGAIFKDGSKASSKTSNKVTSVAQADAAGERKPSAPWQDPILKILAGNQLHDSIRDLAAKLIAAGTDPAAVTNILRGLMEKSAAERDERWQDRYDDIPRAVSSAEEKFSPTPARDLSQLWAKLKEGGERASGSDEPPPPPDDDGEPAPPPDDNKAFFDKVNAIFTQDNFLTWKWKVFPNATREWTRFTENYHTAIDTVLLHHKNIHDKLTAALLLCERCGVDAKLLGYSGPPQPLPPPLIDAKPFVLRDPKTLTKRDWIYGTQLIRKFGSATFAPSGSGKSNLMIIEALAIATGRPLLGILPPKRARVWYWNGEDPFDELERRIGAACLHYGIKPEDIDGWLFVNSGRDPNSQIVIAKQDKSGTTVAVPVVTALVATIRAKKIDVVMIDPFISTHSVTENDNNAIDDVAKTWTMIADVTNTAIDLAHHTRKTGGAAVTVEDGRGASALLNAVRPARVINLMNEDEARKCAIVDGRRRYFKVEDGKNNLALPPDKLDWFRSESIFLGNGDPNEPLDRGDNMGVVTVWEWPNAMEGVTEEDFTKVAEAIRAGQWRKSNTATDWVGHAVARALGLGDVRTSNTSKTSNRGRVNAMVNTWIYEKRLVVVEGQDNKRMTKQFVEVAEVDETPVELAAE